MTLDNQEQLQGRLLLSCEGAGSPLRNMADIDVRNSPYQQRAIVCYLRVEHAPELTAIQAFNHTGPVALLPMGGDLFSLVWSCDEDQCQHWLDAEDGRFINALKAHLRRDFGDISVVSERGSFPLRQMYASQTVSDRLVLLGDSAHVVHPLAGQGVNMGFLDAASLAQIVVDAISNGRDPGDGAVLRRYERWRKGENLATLMGCDAIGRLFSNDTDILRTARRLGLTMVNAAPLVKNQFIRRAMGLVGDLPEAARPG